MRSYLFELASELAYKNLITTPLLLFFLAKMIPIPRLSISSGTVLVALALHFFVSISLPFAKPWYIVAMSFDTNSTKENVTIGSFHQLTQISVSLVPFLLYFR